MRLSSSLIPTVLLLMGCSVTAEPQEEPVAAEAAQVEHDIANERDEPDEPAKAKHRNPAQLD